MKNQINPALDFLVTQAKVWDVELSFHVETFCSETADFSLTYKGTVNKDLKNGGSTKDIFQQMTQNMGYSTVEAYSVRQDTLHDGADIVYLMILNKDGRSYTRNLYNINETYYLDDSFPEYSVIFSKLNNYTTSDPQPGERTATVAHEILHLFGAEDYYSTQRLPLANRYYPFDIMTLNTHKIEWLKIMEMTAFSLGWSDEEPELCYQKVWQEGRFPD